MSTPSFDRFLAAVYRQEPDRVPLAECWIDPEVKEAFRGHPVQHLADDVAFWQAAGYDYIPIDIDIYAAPAIQDSITCSAANTAHAYAARRQERHWAGTATRTIVTPQDVQRFPWPRAIDIDCSPLSDVTTHLPPGMGVVVTCGHVLTAAWQLMGFEPFCLNLYDQPGLVHEVVDRLGCETVALVKRILTFDSVGALWFQDDIAYTNGPMIPPQWLRRIFFPWLAEVAALCHDAGRPLLFHSDGLLDLVMPDIVDAGVDALHPIEPKCMDITSVKRKYGDRLALVGNLDLEYTLTRGSPAEVRRAVRRLIRDVAPGGGFLLGSANSVTNYVPLANFEAMLDAGREFGAYPISLQGEDQP